MAPRHAELNGIKVVHMFVRVRFVPAFQAFFSLRSTNPRGVPVPTSTPAPPSPAPPAHPQTSGLLWSTHLWDTNRTRDSHPPCSAPAEPLAAAPPRPAHKTTASTPSHRSVSVSVSCASPSKAETRRPPGPVCPATRSRSTDARPGMTLPSAGLGKEHPRIPGWRE